MDWHAARKNETDRAAAHLARQGMLSPLSILRDTHLVFGYASMPSAPSHSRGRIGLSIQILSEIPDGGVPLLQGLHAQCQATRFHQCRGKLTLTPAKRVLKRP